MPVDFPSNLRIPHAHLISDLHLEQERPSMTAIFERFLQGRARTAPVLFLLGDIFEVWVGDDDDDPFVAHMADALQQLHRDGVQIYFMHGNRDFLLGAAYAQRAGMTLLPDPITLELGGVRTVLAHGDAQCTDEVAYQQFRQQARSESWQRQILSMPLNDRRTMARQLRQESTQGQQARADAGMGYADVTQAAVRELVLEQHADRLIHGHTHRPADHVMDLPDGRQAQRIVLSDWHDDRGEALEVCPDGSFIRHTLR
jgi:UDP-2,3-diacylglucosamine hydrolase